VIEMKFRRNIVTSSKRGTQQINVPICVTMNWGPVRECELEFDECTSALIIRPIRRTNINNGESK
jgi:hypothetical protein